MFSCCLFVYLWSVWLLLKKMVFTLEMCTYFALSENKHFQPFDGFDPEVKWILVLADWCLVLVPISSVQSSDVGDGCFATKEQLFCPELKCRLSVLLLGDWSLRQRGPVLGARWMAPPGEGYHLGDWNQTTRTSLGSMAAGSTWGGLSLRRLESETTRTSLESMVCGSTWGGLSLRQLESETTRTSFGSMVDGSNWMGYHLGDWSLRQQGPALRAWYVAPPGEGYHLGDWNQTRTSLGSMAAGSTWGGLSLRRLESETTRTSLESMVCGSTWGGLSLRRLECETTRTSFGSIKDGSSWWGLSLTFAPAWGSSTSSPAGHQSSTCGEQRWGRSEGSCRWCPVPVLTTRLLMLSGLTGGNKTPKQHNTHYVQFTHYHDQMFSQCRRKTTEKHIHLLSQENTHTSSWNNNTCQR